VLNFAAVYITWGSTYLGIAYSVRTIPVFLIGAARFLISGLVLIALARFTGAAAPTRRQWLSATLAGVLLLTLGNSSVVWAETRVPSGTTALMVTTPFWLVVFEWLRGRRPSVSIIAGLVIGALGIGILVGPRAIAGSGQVDPLAAAVLIVGSVFWALGSVYTRYADLPQSPLMATGAEMLCGSIALFALAALTGELSTFSLDQVSTPSWLGFWYLVTFGSLIGFTSYIWLMRNVPTHHAATYAFVNPIVAVFIGWLIAGEQLSPRIGVASVVIIGAVVVITRGR